MRAGAGTSKGELLTVQVEDARDLVDWQDKRFSADRSMGEMVLPEAFHCVAGVLPHLHDDFEQRFPKAEAAEDLCDVDPIMDSSLEARGASLGQRKVRFQ